MGSKLPISGQMADGIMQVLRAASNAKKLAAMDAGVRPAFIDTATGRIAIGLKLMWPSHNANLFISFPVYMGCGESR